MTDKQLEKLGSLIARTREKRGLTLRDVAEQLGVDASWVLRLERGEIREPSPEKLASSLEILDLSASRIDRMTGGYLSGGLLGSRDYFRARYDLNAEETDFIEAEIAKLKKRGK
jgi:transcriptional regulator with XRE-family HTH domain